VAYGRALWAITPMALGVYLAYLVLGRGAVPAAVVAGFLYLATGILAVHQGYVPLPDDTPTRATRWYPAARAVLETPSLLGAGLVDPGPIIAPYHPWRSTGSPHDSYLMTGIRAGILGGFAYVLLVLASLGYGVLDREGDVAVLAMAVGFTAHQMFEAYTLFNWGSSTVLAASAFGFLGFGGLERASLTPAR
jgi:O-antigen ligase